MHGKGKLVASAKVICLALSVSMAIERATAETGVPAASPGGEKVLGTLPAGRPMVPLAGEWRVQFVKEPGQLPGEKWAAKPVLLPATVRFPNTKEGVEQNGVWFEREVVIPADWQGRRILVRVGRSMYGVAVYANQVKAGEIPGYGGEAEVTSQATPGQPAKLRLYCGRLGQGIESLDRVSRSAATYNAQKDPGRNWLAAPTGIFGRPEEFCLESRPRDLAVSGVWYQTPVRGGVRIEPVFALWSAAPRDNLSCRVSIHEIRGKTAIEGVFPLRQLPAGESLHRFSLPATTLRLWGIREPNLYVGQVTILDGAGRELDRSVPARFGIREFWSQGRQLCLNGQPVYPVPTFCGWTEPEGLDELLAAGITLVQTGFPFWFRYFDSDYTPLADACDERGMLFVPPGMTHHELNLSDPELLADYTTWAEHYYGRYANHPSIVIYGLGINSPGNFIDFSPVKMGRMLNVDWNIAQTSRSYLVSRRIDPTRLYYFHGGPRGGDAGSANFYPNHIPTQEVEDWPTDWAEKGDRPFLTLEGLLCPIDVDYRKGASYLTEYLAMLGGDEAYAAETETYRSYSTYEHCRLEFWGYAIRSEHNRLMFPQRCSALRRTGRAWRFYGVPFNQWYGGLGTPGWKKDQVKDDWIRTGDALRQSDIVWIGGPENDFSLKDHNYYSGETITKTVAGIRDQNGSATWDATWELKESPSGTSVGRGQLTRKMAAFARLKAPFQVHAPERTSPSRLDLTLSVRNRDTGEEVGSDTFAISVYPRRPPPAPGKRDMPFRILDPEGETTTWLKSVGASVEPSRDRPGDGDHVLVVGRRALRGLKTLPFTAKEIEDGLRVVVFEQHCPELGKLGFRHEDRCPRQVFVRQAEHPLAAGLTAEGLRDWRGHGTLISAGPFGDRLAVSGRLNHWGNRGTVASAILETPHFGPFVPILDCEFDLAYTPLLSWRHGKGEVLFCQLDLTSRIGREPEADRVAENLVQYLRAPPTGRQDKVVATLEESTAKAIEAFGFAAVLSPALRPGQHVLVLSGSAAETLAKYRAQVAAFLKDGGDLLVLGAEETLLADPLFGGRLKVERSRVTGGGTEVPRHPLLRGVGPQDLHWRAPTDLLTVTSGDPKFVPLLRGLVGILPLGKGRIILFQVEPKRMSDLAAVKELDPKKGDPKAKVPKDDWFRSDRVRTMWHVNRLHALLLANLGVRSSDALTRRLFEIKQSMPTAPVNEWVVLGPIPPWDGKNTDNGEDPLDRKNLDELASHRELSYEFRNERGETVRWVVPSDSNNGLGLDGKNDLGKIYGVHLKDSAIAVTHVWSTREREAVIGIGADWWLRVDVNGKEVFRTRANPWTFGINFDRKLRVPLRAGWNEILCVISAGSNGHIFWFEMTNPGDLVVAQQLRPPDAAPTAIPPIEDLIPEEVDPGFQFYTDRMTAALDPYAYIPW